MPGASLWLIPSSGGRFDQAFTHLISSLVPFHFSDERSYPFMPHVTITSDINPDVYGDNPTQWLESLDVPSLTDDDNRIQVALDHYTSREMFSKKLVISVREHDGLSQLASDCRRQAVESEDATAVQKWLKYDFDPHMSLMYGHVSTVEVLAKMSAIRDFVADEMDKLERSEDGAVETSASLVLVDTTKPVAGWVPIAKREGFHVQWRWVIQDQQPPFAVEPINVH